MISGKIYVSVIAFVSLFVTYSFFWRNVDSQQGILHFCYDAKYSTTVPLVDARNATFDWDTSPIYK